jgi:hypothetical protein
MSSGLDPVAWSAVREYLGLLDSVLPGAWVYLTGSAALGDWQPERSDLDILTVLPGPADLDALDALHAGRPGRPYRDAVYVPRDLVGGHLAADCPGLPHAIDGVFHRSGYRPDPVLWATLHRHGLTVRGPEAASLRAAPDPAWLREWNRGNLRSYWRPLAAKSRALVADRPPQSPLPAYPVVWGALGPGRLHCTIATGQIISKTAAARYTARLHPGQAGLLERAKAWRLGDKTVAFTVADGLACCDLVDEIVEDAG